MSLRATADIERAMSVHSDTVWRVASVVLNNAHDVQDAYQEVFLKYAQDSQTFQNEEHLKAWFIRVTRNKCLDMMKAAYRQTSPLDEAPLHALADVDPLEQPGSTYRHALDAINNLTDPPRTPVYLALVEGYTAPEIAKMIDAPVNTVYSWVARGKEQLKEALQ